MSAARTIVAVRFGKSERQYDYFCDFPIEVGQSVRVETRHGWSRVEVVEIKATSDRATQSVQPYEEDAA